MKFVLVQVNKHDGVTITSVHKTLEALLNQPLVNASSVRVHRMRDGMCATTNKLLRAIRRQTLSGRFTVLPV